MINKPEETVEFSDLDQCKLNQHYHSIFSHGNYAASFKTVSHYYFIISNERS